MGMLQISSMCQEKKEEDDFPAFKIHTLAQGGCVVHLCQNKNPEACAEDFVGFEKSQLVESWGPKKKGDFR